MVLGGGAVSYVGAKSTLGVIDLGCGAYPENSGPSKSDQNRLVPSFKNNYFAEMSSHSEVGSYFRLIHFCITQQHYLAFKIWGFRVQN